MIDEMWYMGAYLGDYDVIIPGKHAAEVTKVPVNKRHTSK